MGAQIFKNLIRCQYPEEGFLQLTHAHSLISDPKGYSGTIAEKDDFIVIEIPPEFQSDPSDGDYGRVIKYADHLIETRDPRVDDKWGPAAAIRIESKASWYFFGWASD